MDIQKHQKYHKRKEKGLCVRCAEPALLNKTLCANHAKKQNVAGKLWTRNHQAHRTAYFRLHTHGVTPEQFIDMLFDQNGRCGSCGDFFRKTPHVDHNHKTGKVRGLLCARCNLVLGLVEDPVHVERARDYLRRFDEISQPTESTTLEPETAESDLTTDAIEAAVGTTLQDLSSQE